MGNDCVLLSEAFMGNQGRVVPIGPSAISSVLEILHVERKEPK